MDDLDTLFERVVCQSSEDARANVSHEEYIENSGEDVDGSVIGSDAATCLENQKTCTEKFHEDCGGSSRISSLRATDIAHSPEFADSKPEVMTTLFERLLTMSPEDVVRKLASPTFGLCEILDKTPFPPEAIPLVIKVLRTTASSSLHQSDLLIVLNDVLSSKLFLTHLPEYLTKASYGRVACPDMPDLLQNVVALSSRMVECFPHSASEKLGLVFLKCRDIIRRHEGESVMDPWLLQNIDQMEALQESLVVKYSAAARKRRAKEEFLQVLPPPNDFREMSVVITPADIHNVFMPFLRPVVIGGRFQSTDHYLDVLFRLMREDFVGPLREAICYYLSLLSRGKLNELDFRKIRIYFDVMVIEEELKQQKGVMFKVNFDVSKFRRVDWLTTKRLQHGSLVCLSADNFQTFFLATVGDRLVTAKARLNVDVKFIGSFPDVQSTQLYVMIESPAFFEAYYYVLLGLQDFAKENLPFQKYLVEATADVSVPKYLCGNLIPYRFSAKVQCNVLNFESWPTAEQLHLDKSQYAALKTALTKELAIIQGPPGTGKTYLGLKVMSILLTNRQLQQSTDKGNNDKSVVGNHYETALCDYYGIAHHDECETVLSDEGCTPILVICYTNHALDQFLEGILKLSVVLRQKVTPNIVRVGGRSKSEALKMYNLSVKRRQYGYRGYGEDWRDSLTSIEAQISRMNKFLKKSETKVLSEMELSNEIHRMHLTQLNMFYRWEDQPDDTSAMEYWLQCGQELNCDRVLVELGKKGAVSSEVVNHVNDIYRLSADDRWKLYRFWVTKFREKICCLLLKLKENYDRAATMLKYSYEEMDIRILRDSDVIGMTTSGAGKNREVLKRIGSRIVVVEEAAEILESHILIGLTKHCQHLILIGDHQQLRPNPTVYRLAKDFHLDVSLFERLILNGVHCDSLELQHRMRPEIASLLVPHIYPSLKNHESVEKYGHIQGVDRDLFFLDHRWEEKSVFDSSSRSNDFEANFAIALCKYLLKQGYRPEKITIMTTYIGQVLLLKQLIKDAATKEFNGVQCVAVDNYQGEENDIVILSLVRSNEDGAIGFLRVDNRVCVALSRARMGLYAIGNFEFLADNSDIWKPIVQQVKADGKLGPALALHCPNHPNVKIQAANAYDFKKCPEGGCMLPCQFQLRCGHLCTRFCHGYDRTHEAFCCQKRCEIILCELGHRCPLKCRQSCKPCAVPVSKKMPNCGHENVMDCSFDPLKFICKQPCKKIFSCGHPCPHLCYQQCKKCVVQILKKMPDCKHENVMDCSVEPQEFICRQPCEKVLSCGHQCPNLCHQQCEQIILRIPTPHLTDVKCCEVKVPKTLPDCGHEQQVPCRVDPKRFACKNPCERVLACGHSCPLLCHKKCEPENCKIHVEFVLACGHQFSGKCKQRLRPCPQKVEKVLECGHKVSTVCSDDLKNYVCRVEMKKVLQCGHESMMYCSQPITKYFCEVEVEKMLKCDHQLTTRCGTDISKLKCKVIVKATLDCRHKVEVQCCDSENKMFLKNFQHQCGILLLCGHECRGKCHECFGGRIHIRCIAKCSRVLICGHPCQSLCGTSCPPCRRICENRCPHEICNGCCGFPCRPCQKPCSWRCKHYRCSKKCYEVCDRPACQEPCSKMLKCGHSCVGFCGEPCPPQCRYCDKGHKAFQKCSEGDEIRFVWLEDCGHIVSTKEMDLWVEKSVLSLSNCLFKVTCLECRTVIRHNFRYNEIIKTAAMNAAFVKHELFSNDMKAQRPVKGKSADKGEVFSDTTRYLKNMGKAISELCQNLMNQQESSDFFNCKSEEDHFCKDALLSGLNAVMGWLAVVNCESKEVIEWYSACREYLKVQYLAEVLKLVASGQGPALLSQVKLFAILCSRTLFTKDREIYVKERLEHLLMQNGSGKLPELKQVKIAIEPDSNADHWYSCENGHCYYFSRVNYSDEERSCSCCKNGARPVGQKALMQLFKRDFGIREKLEAPPHGEQRELETLSEKVREISLKLDEATRPNLSQGRQNPPESTSLVKDPDPWRRRGGWGRGQRPGRNQHNQARSVSRDRELPYRSRDGSPSSISSEPVGRQPTRGRWQRGFRPRDQQYPWAQASVLALSPDQCGGGRGQLPQYKRGFPRRQSQNDHSEATGRGFAHTSASATNGKPPTPAVPNRGRSSSRGKRRYK